MVLLRLWSSVIPVTALVPNPQSLIPRVADALLSALLAPACAVCDAILDDPLRGCVCRNCWGAIRPITPPLCDCCGDPLARPNQSLISNPQSPRRDPQSLCRQCAGRERIIERSRTVGEYEGALRDIIHALKYHARRSLARPLARHMRSRGLEILEAADCVVPVPLHWRREYHRGFNQARDLATHLDLPVLDVLVRTRHTRPQVELAAESRRENVETAFAWREPLLRKPRSIDGLKVVLVDDVSTTGATLEACAQVLKKAGASEVYALTAARVVTRRRL